MDRHYNGLEAKAFEAPSTVELTSYAQAYADVFEATTGGARALVPTVYDGSAPYRAVSFRLSSRGTQGRNPDVVSEAELDRLLMRLEKSATDQHSHSFYLARNIKVFEADVIHIVKPSERRFWTSSAAYNDARRDHRSVVAGGFSGEQRNRGIYYVTPEFQDFAFGSPATLGRELSPQIERAALQLVVDGFERWKIGGFKRFGDYEDHYTIRLVACMKEIQRERNTTLVPRFQNVEPSEEMLEGLEEGLIANASQKP